MYIFIHFDESGMNPLRLATFFIILVPGIFLCYALLQSIFEDEFRAAKRLGLLFAFWLLHPSAFFLFQDCELLYDFFLVESSVIAVAGFVVIFPWPEKPFPWQRGTPARIDERNIMFSRAELVPGSNKYNAYYAEFPGHKEPDDNFRKYPGLLKTGSTYYNPWLFAAADASFFTVESLHSKTDGPVEEVKQVVNPEHITRFIKKWAKEMGCHSSGITELRPYHLYHKGGRRHNYGLPVNNDHKFAIVFAVEMDFNRVRSAPKGPVVMESSSQYLNSGTVAVQAAAFIRNLGYSALAHIDGKYQVRCTEVARDAGLGELGRMSLLMTPRLGPRVRISIVTTDMPLIVSPCRPDQALLKFCSMCRKCAQACPSQAIPFDEPRETGGAIQWAINQEACFTYWCKAGTDCGRCLSVCPYSHPDNLLHNVVRLLIKSSPLFRRFALKMDNWLYGKIPPVKNLPGWMTV